MILIVDSMPLWPQRSPLLHFTINYSDVLFARRQSLAQTTGMIAEYLVHLMIIGIEEIHII